MNISLLHLTITDRANPVLRVLLFTLMVGVGVGTIIKAVVLSKHDVVRPRVEPPSHVSRRPAATPGSTAAADGHHMAGD
jgi:hypothetical protein